MAVRDFLLPDLGEGLEDAEIVAWHVAEGDHVALNQTLVEVNTAKALVEIPAPWEGKVERLHGVQGDVVKVGAPLVSIRVESAEDPEGRGEQGGPAAEGSRPKRRAVLVGYGVEEEEPEALRPPRVAPTAGGPGATEASRPVPASPPVRRLAKELGIELSAVEGTGPGGRVTREDVMRASEGGLSPAQDGQDAQAAPVRPEMGEFDAVPLRGTRRLIAEKMSRSAREIPHVTTFLTVDATSLQAFRDELATEANKFFADTRTLLEKNHLQAALQMIWSLVTRANQYVDHTAPFQLAKDPAKAQRLDEVLEVARLLEHAHALA